ncbi:MAG: ABC transporter ATP-binding protein [Deltaproteobacteria bacterium]|nr:ABC transporter ATP-binding protein [Deltaproteobacteria bacterium]MBW2362944.1 ABC transporter ATP-binding protein [Deltaproteobacteria bacterium]
MFALEFSRVTKRYGRREALREVDLRVPEGSALGLLGPNGAGKTTALRLLLGFTRPTVGDVRLRGSSAGEPRSRVGVGYLPERLQLPARMTVKGLLRLHGRLAGLAGGELEREIAGALEKTGLADRSHDRLGSLSKGLLQRAGFAQALLGRPAVLLLDEPTSGLDPLGIRDARDWIQQERERGCTVLVSSHVLSEVERICDSAAILHEGRIVKHGPIDSLAEPGESLEDAFVRAVRG